MSRKHGAPGSITPSALRRSLLGASCALALVAAARGLAAGELLASYHINEGQGQGVADTSVGGHPAQLGPSSGVDAEDPSWTSGQFGGALHFEGGQYAAVPNAPALEPSLVSVEVWVRSTSPGQYGYIVAKGADGCSHASYALYGGGDAGLVFYTRTAAELLYSADAGPGVWDGFWHHVVGTYDGLHARLFVDGKEAGAPNPASTPLSPIAYGLPTSSDLAIGAYLGSCPLSFSGDIDEVKIWSRALSPAEIAARGLGD